MSRAWVEAAAAVAAIGIAIGVTHAAASAPVRVPGDDVVPAVSGLGDLGTLGALAISDDGSMAAGAFAAEKPGRSVLRVFPSRTVSAGPAQVAVRGRIRALRFSRDGADLFVLAARDSKKDNGDAFLLRITVATLEVSRENVLPRAASDLDSIDAGTLIVASPNELRTFFVPELSSGPLYRLDGSNRAVVAIPGTRRLLVARDDSIVLVDLDDPQSRDGLPARERLAIDTPVVALAIAPDGDEALARHEDGRVERFTVSPLGGATADGNAVAIAWPGRRENAPPPAPRPQPNPSPAPAAAAPTPEPPAPPPVVRAETPAPQTPAPIPPQSALPPSTGTASPMTEPGSSPSPQAAAPAAQAAAVSPPPQGSGTAPVGETMPPPGSAARPSSATTPPPQPPATQPSPGSAASPSAATVSQPHPPAATPPPASAALPSVATASQPQPPAATPPPASAALPSVATASQPQPPAATPPPASAAPPSSATASQAQPQPQSPATQPVVPVPPPNPPAPPPSSAPASQPAANPPPLQPEAPPAPEPGAIPPGSSETSAPSDAAATDRVVLRGSVTGAALANVTAVVIRGPDNLLHEAARVKPAADGSWSATDLAPGSYRIQLDAGSGRVVEASPAFRTVRIEHNGTIEVAPIEARRVL